MRTKQYYLCRLTSGRNRNSEPRILSFNHKNTITTLVKRVSSEFSIALRERFCGVSYML